jgi:hypothetical protein
MLKFLYQKKLPLLLPQPGTTNHSFKIAYSRAVFPGFHIDLRRTTVTIFHVKELKKMPVFPGCPDLYACSTIG